MIRERDTLLYGGKRFRVEVTKAEQPPHNRVSIEDDIIHVSMLGNEDPEAILRIWLTAKTKTLVNRIICSHASQFQAKPSDVAIRNTRRWGYCTRKGRLVFNWQLAALPREIA